MEPILKIAAPQAKFSWLANENIKTQSWLRRYFEHMICWEIAKKNILLLAN